MVGTESWLLGPGSTWKSKSPFGDGRLLTQANDLYGRRKLLVSGDDSVRYSPCLMNFSVGRGNAAVRTDGAP